MIVPKGKPIQEMMDRMREAFLWTFLKEEDRINGVNGSQSESNQEQDDQWNDLTRIRRLLRAFLDCSIHPDQYGDD